MSILCAHPAFRVLEMSLSQLGEKQIAPDEALNDRSLLSISQWWTDKNYFARVQGNAAETGHHTQLPGNSPGRGIVSQFRMRHWRHTVGTLLAELGEHQLTIRDYLRHSNLSVTNKYLQAASNTKRKAQTKLVEAILPVEMRVTTIAEVVAPLLHPNKAAAKL